MRVKENLTWNVCYNDGITSQAVNVLTAQDVDAECQKIEEIVNPESIEVVEVTIKSWFYKGEVNDCNQ